MAIAEQNQVNIRLGFREIKQLTRKILEENMIVKPPIIAAELILVSDLVVSCGTFKPEYEHISGFLDIDNKKIVINAIDSPSQQNYTIAHEFGHYLLGHYQEAEYAPLLRDSRAMKKTLLEQRASYFAANLLVPDMFLREYIDRYPLIEDYQLTRIFGVPLEIIRYRKRYL